MNKFLKSLILSVCLYIIHILILSTFSLYENSNEGYGIIASAIYIFIVAFWAYYLLVLIYVFSTKFLKNKMQKIIMALLLMGIGYLLSRGGDIIDGDFIKNYNWKILLGFILSSFLIVLLDNTIGRKSA